MAGKYLHHYSRVKPGALRKALDEISPPSTTERMRRAAGKIAWAALGLFVLLIVILEVLR